MEEILLIIFKYDLLPEPLSFSVAILVCVRENKLTFIFIAKSSPLYKKYFGGTTRSWPDQNFFYSSNYGLKSIQSSTIFLKKGYNLFHCSVIVLASALSVFLDLQSITVVPVSTSTIKVL